MYDDIEVTLMETEEFAYHVTHTLRLIKVTTVNHIPLLFSPGI